MADRTIWNNLNSLSYYLGPGAWGPYYLNTGASGTGSAAWLMIDSTDQIRSRYTIDGGANITGDILDSDTFDGLACFYDREVPGDTGSLIHCIVLNNSNDNAEYFSFNLDGMTKGASITISGAYPATHIPNNRSVIGKTRGGNLMAAYSTPSGTATFKSTDGGSNWTSVSGVFESGNDYHWALFFPANTSDDNDLACIYRHSSNSDISLKMYDDSADGWSTTEVGAGIYSSSLYMNMDSAVRHSDGKILVVAHSNDDNSGDDLRTYVVTPEDTPSAIPGSNVFTNQSESAQCAIVINQQNDDVYVAYLRGGTWKSSLSVYYKKSDDDMQSWSSESQINVTNDDHRAVFGGHTIGNEGGIVQFTWFNDDTSDLLFNSGNNIFIGSASSSTDYTWTGSESLSFSDSLSRESIFIRTNNDSMAISDSLNSSVNYLRTQSDNISLVDTLNSAIAQLEANISDSLTLADNLIKVADYNKTISDNTTFSETLSTQKDIERELSDNINLLDSITAGGNILQNIVDTITLDDSLKTEKTINRELSEILIISDNTLSTLTKLLELADNLVLTDSLSTSLGELENLYSYLYPLKVPKNDFKLREQKEFKLNA